MNAARGRCRRDESGATLAEYALVIGLIAAVVAASVGQIATSVVAKFDSARSGIENSAAVTP